MSDNTDVSFPFDVDQGLKRTYIITVIVLSVTAVVQLIGGILLARSNNRKYARTDYESDGESDMECSDGQQAEQDFGEHEEEMSSVSSISHDVSPTNAPHRQQQQQQQQ